MNTDERPLAEIDALARLLAKPSIETTVSELSRQWGWNRTKVLRRLKRWADDGYLVRAFAPVEEGQTVHGKLLGSSQLASGRFAMIDDGLGFSLVPWRPVLENKLGREVTGVMRGEDISWQFGRRRTLGIGV